MLSWQLSEIFNNNFFKKRKKALLWEKKHSYKKHGSDIYRKSNYATFLVTSRRFLYFSKELAQFIISRKKSLKVVNNTYNWVLKILDLPKLSGRYQPTRQTSMIDIYAILPQNVSFLECFWRSHVCFIRYCNSPTEITRNHFYDVFLWRIFDKPKILARDFFETS